MTIEVTIEQVIEEYYQDHRGWVGTVKPRGDESEIRQYVERLLDTLNDKDTAYLLIRLLHTVPTAQGRKAAIAQLRDEEVI